MKATPSDQNLLLDLVALDRAFERAKAARKNPPQAARVSELVAQRNEQGRALVDHTNARDDVKLQLTRVESDISVARSRQQRDRDRLNQTAIARDARALEAEIEALDTRIDDLETRELELMEELEQAESRASEQQRLLDETSAEGQRLSTEGKAAVEEAAAEIERIERDRAAVTGRLPDDLLAEYTRIANRTVGAGFFQHGTCGACHMTLAPTDVAQIARAADDDVVHCPECSCIVVRTAESGL